MFSFLTDLEIDLLVGVVAFAAGVVLSQKVKDKLKGIPGELRTALSGAESSALAAIKAAEAKAIAEFLPGGTTPKAALPAAAPAPVAPPAPTVVVQAAAPVAQAAPAAPVA